MCRVAWCGERRKLCAGGEGGVQAAVSDHYGVRFIKMGAPIEVVAVLFDRVPSPSDDEHKGRAAVLIRDSTIDTES